MKTKAGIQIASMAALALPLVMTVGCAGGKQNVAATDVGDNQATQAAIASMEGYMASLVQQQENTNEEGSGAVTQPGLSTEEAITPVQYEYPKEEAPLQEAETPAIAEAATLPEAQAAVTDSEALSLDPKPTSSREEEGEMQSQYMLSGLQQMTFYFDSNSDTPAASDLETLMKHAQYLKEHPNMLLVINGHSDSRGSQGYNQRLSKLRAVNVAYILLEAGVSGNQLRLKGMGYAEPRTDSINYRENRRVEFMYQDSMLAKK